MTGRFVPPRIFFETFLGWVALCLRKEHTVSDRLRDKKEIPPSGTRQRRLALYFWLMFAAGLALQAMAPRLKIENHAFVMPPTVNVQGATIRRDTLVQRD
jgi:hypothetical protein